MVGASQTSTFFFIPCEYYCQVFFVAHKYLSPAKYLIAALYSVCNVRPCTNLWPTDPATPPPPQTPAPPPVQMFNMTPEILAHIIRSATEVPLQQVVQQQQQMQGFCENLQTQHAQVQTLLLDQIRALQPEGGDPLKRLRQKNPSSYHSPADLRIFFDGCLISRQRKSNDSSLMR